MKTTLKQQLELVNALEHEPSKPLRIKLLRAFLTDHGYEDMADCKHHTIIRITGRCSTCGVPVADPMPSGSSESVLALRDRLRD